MTRRGFRRPDGEAGAYAILYGILLLAICGMAAIVVDLGALREDRRQTRLASDAAAVYGARSLDFLSNTANPRQACTDSWSYLATNLDFTAPTDPAVTGCINYPVTYTGTCSPPPVYPLAVGTAGDYTVTVTWPVADNSPLLTQPNINPASTTQNVDTAVDGDNPCARLAVSVQQTQKPAFAGVFGTGTTTTTVTSVARSTTTPGGDGPLAALNVLEPKDCDAISMSGQGFIQIKHVGLYPGIISVESTGRQSGGSCPSASPWVIDAAKTSSGAYIRADGTVDGDGQGIIFSYALNAGVGNPTQAYNPSLVPPGSTLLMPVPSILPQASREAPIRNIYDATTGSFLTNLKTAFGGGGTPTPYADGAAPYNVTPFITLPNANPLYSAFSCNDSPSSKVRIPVGNYYLNCNTLNVAGILVFQGGNVVTKGGISVSGCLGINVPISGSGQPVCPSLNVAKDDVSTPPPVEGLLYMRGGDLTKNSQGSIFLARTFTYMTTGGGTGKLLWTNPAPTDPLCDKTCAAKRFGKMALWNETVTTNNATEQSIGGQSALVLRGILFLPKSTFVYTGGTSVSQTKAQFWCNKIEIKGQGGLTMAPDLTTGEPLPLLGTVLIR
jgi:hypothetical protein